jgi:xanthine permease XanP
LDERPPLPVLAVIGLQYVVVLSIPLIYAVVVASAAGESLDQEINLVSLSMIGAALGGLLQGMKIGPIGSGFLIIPNLSSVHLAGSLVALRIGGMPMVWGLVVGIGLLQTVASRFLRPLRFLLPTELAGLAVLLTGVTLATIGIPDMIDNTGDAGVHLHLLVACSTLAVMVACSVWESRLRLFSAALGIACGYAASLMFGTIGAGVSQSLSEMPWFRLPRFGISGLAFSPALFLPLLVGGAAATLSTIACITAAQKTNDADWRRQDLGSLSGGVLADGLGTIVAGLLGGIGQSASAASVGLAASTRATSRVVALRLR